MSMFFPHEDQHTHKCEASEVSPPNKFLALTNAFLCTDKIVREEVLAYGTINKLNHSKGVPLFFASKSIFCNG